VVGTLLLVLSVVLKTTAADAAQAVTPVADVGSSAEESGGDDKPTCPFEGKPPPLAALAGKPGKGRLRWCKADLAGKDLGGANLMRADLREANLRGSELSGVALTGADLRKANLAGAKLFRAVLSGAYSSEAKPGAVIDAWAATDMSEGYIAGRFWSILSAANLTEADLTGANLAGADLGRANFAGANLTGADLADARVSHANLTGADLTGANLRNADLTGADLTGANLSRANLTGADLTEVNLRGARLSLADFTRANLAVVNFEPVTDSLQAVLAIETARNLSRLTYRNAPTALIALRERFVKGGFRDQERQLTFAKLRSQRALGWSEGGVRSIEAVFSYVAFELPCGYGRDYGLPLRILGISILMLAGVYTFVMRNPGATGALWRVWSSDRIRTDEGQSAPERLRWEPPARPGEPRRSLAVRFGRALGLGLLFSLLSAFQIGWRELNVGNWITRLLPREYTLKASGWVRIVSGLQSLLSVYLLALAVLTYFGRPFE
jgi:uncharacterized protein YjbI with pentapeptide repeats